jgi:hypothetical protein
LNVVAHIDRDEADPGFAPTRPCGSWASRPLNVQPVRCLDEHPGGVERDIQFLPTVCKPGDYLLLRAEIDLVIAFSACPQDILAINNTRPVEAHFDIV